MYLCQPLEVRVTETISRSATVHRGENTAVTQVTHDLTPFLDLVGGSRTMPRRGTQGTGSIV